MVIDLNKATPPKPVDTVVSVTDAMIKFQETIAAGGYGSPIIHPDTDDVVRFEMPGGKPGNRAGWYIFYSDGIPAGAFGSWRDSEAHSWSAKKEIEMDPQEREAHRRKMELAKQARIEAKRIAAEQAAIHASQLWNSSPVCGTHPYLSFKQVQAINVRVTGEGVLLIPMVDLNGNIHSLQRIWPDGTKRFFKDGDPRGHFCYLHGDEKTIYICEGYATGVSVHMATGGTVFVAFNAGNLKAVGQVVRSRYPSAKIVFAADNDLWSSFKKDGEEIENPGVWHAKSAASEVNGFVVAPEFQDLSDQPSDFNDLMVKEGIVVVRDQFDVAATLEVWPDPVDITKNDLVSPAWPAGVLPYWIEAFVTDTADRMQVPTEMVAVSTLVTLATAIGKGVHIQLKRKDTKWQERACLWGIVVAPKGSKKSPVLNAITAPLIGIEKAATERYQDQLRKYQVKKEEHDAKVSVWKSELRKQMKAGKPLSDKPILDIEPPRQIRRILNDTTQEAAAAKMKDSPGLLMLHDELAGWFSNMSRYNNGSDRQFYLTCHTGGLWTVDRKGANTLVIDDAYLCVLGGIQFPVLRDIFDQRDRGKDDGMFERFGLMALYKEIPFDEVVDRKANYDASKSYENTILTLSSTVWRNCMWIDQNHPDRPFAKFEEKDGAQDAFLSWYAANQRELASMSEDDPIKGFVSKAPGLIARIALVIHLADWASGTEGVLHYNVSMASFEKARSILDNFLIPTWRNCMKRFEKTAPERLAAKLASRLLSMVQGGAKTVTVRDISRMGMKGMTKADDVREVMAELHIAGWVSEPVMGNDARTGRKAPTEYQLNPKLRSLC